MILFLLSLFANAECPEDQDALQVALERAASAERAFSGLDDEGFSTAYAELTDSVGCIDVEISIPDAVVLHRAKALGAFVAGDAEASRKSWAAVRALQPDWRPPESLMPVGHPLRSLWEESVTLPSTALQLELGPKGGWGVDGTRLTVTSAVPDSRAFVLQGFDSYGQVLHTGYHLESTTVPVLDDMVAVAKMKVRDPIKRRKKIRTVGTAVGGTLLAGAGGFWLASHLRKKTYLDKRAAGESVNHSEAQTQTNTYGGLAIGLAAAGAIEGTLIWTVKW